MDKKRNWTVVDPLFGDVRFTFEYEVSAEQVMDYCLKERYEGVCTNLEDLIEMGVIAV